MGSSVKQICFYLFLAYICVFADENAEDRVTKGIRHEFSDEELRRIFGTKDTSEVPDYEVVHPHTVDDRAEHSRKAQKKLHHIHPMYIHFKAFGLDFHLNLTLNKDLLPHEYFIEHHTKDGVERLSGRAKTHSTGKIVNDDESNVALDHTSGLHGIVARENDMYIIAPLPKRLVELDKEFDSSHGAHIVYKRSALPNAHPHRTQSCGFTDDVQSFKNLKNSLRRRRRSTSSQPEKIMELMIAADRERIEFYGKAFLHSYLINIGNIVAGVFKDPSLEYPITVVVTRVVLIDSGAFDNITEISPLLGKFSQWVNQNNPTDDADPLHVDNAMLLSKWKCYVNCTVIRGLAYTGMCSQSSHSVTRDDGLMSALTAVHEIGHNLDLMHDNGNASIPGECPDGVNIMAAGNVNGAGAFEFSKCHSKELADRLRSSKSFCFNDKPTAPVLSNNSFLLYGQVYDGDKQCQLAFDASYKQCSGISDHCSNLRCIKPGEDGCDGSIYPPAQGTRCTPHHWCIYGQCVRDNSPLPKPIDGGWSDYSDYTKCNRDCGGGVQWRERTCTNPAPQHGGKSCEGITKGYFKTCNMDPCPAGTITSRNAQCLKYGAGSYSLYEVSAPCKLICKTPDRPPSYYRDVDDGTFVDNDVSLEASVGYKNSYDMCIQGKRTGVGCDKVLNSGAVHDRCNVCGGDGSTCKPVVGVNMSPFQWGGTTYDVSTVPSNILNFDVKELAPTYNFLSVRVGQSSDNAYYVPSWSKSVSFAGLTCNYKMEAYNYADHLICQGKSNDVVKIVWRNVYGGNSAGIKWTYYEPADSNSSSFEYAVSSTWGSCSKSCAGGIQLRSVICRRTDDKTAVSVSYCKAASLTKPADTQPCNTQACPAQWYIHPWGKCSKTCGSGQRARNVTCSEQQSDGTYRTVADASSCTATKPTVSVLETCNVIMCAAEWNIGVWGSCSATCGNGTETREVTCKRINADGSVTETRDLECLISKPITIQPCNTDNPCPAWVIMYGSCSKTCGGGLKQPYAACYRLDQRLDDGDCSSSSKPSVSSIPPKSCNVEACDSYEWYTQDGTCSVSCGNGVIPVNVTCKRVRDSLVVSEDLCTNATKPATTKSCYAGECPEIYEWKIVPGACSVTCGTGTMTNKVVCIKKSTGASVQEDQCVAHLKPAVGPAKECNLGSCPETYSWNITEGPCSVTCGIGVRQSIVQCKRDSDYAVVDDSKCLLIKPSPGSFSCNMGECPVRYEWREVFGDCSAPCGKGTKTSNFKCFMVSSSTLMSDSYCSSLPKNSSRTVECTVQCNWAPVYGPCLANCGSGEKLISLICQNDLKAEVAISYCASKAIGSYSPQSCSVKACTEYAPDLTSIPKFYSVGCYKDNINNRHLPNSVGNLRNQITNWHDLSNVVKGCAVKAAGYKYFSVQYYGECWASNERKYFFSGESKNCYLGTGGERVNYVYTFNAPDAAPSLTAIKPLGCFADDISKPRPLPQLIDNYRYMLETQTLDSSIAAIMISKCAKVAKMRGYTTFGIQYYGECWSGPNANATYNEDGRSNSCVHGLGGGNSYYVYIFT